MHEKTGLTTKHSPPESTKTKERVDYIYDGTFSGFLCCVHCYYYSARPSGIFTAENYQNDMLNPARFIESDEETAQTVYQAIMGKISPHDLKRVYAAFCSNVPGKEMRLLAYIVLGFREGSRIRLLHGNPAIHEVERMEKKVATEVHRLCGLIRFSDMAPSLGDTSLGQESLLYSPIEPDNNVLEFLGDHFSDRLKNETFLIHDKKRNKALVSTKGAWYISDFAEDDLLEKTMAENEYRRLWRTYFDTIAIKERINPSCQKRFMPARYWKNLTEFSML